MNTSKIIKGVVGGGRYTVTAPIVKEDYGLYLKLEGLELPATYEVDFSNSEHNGTSVTMIGNADGVLIPSQFISTGKDIFAFLYHVGVDFGRTLYKFRIPNKLRPDRTDEEPTPEEQSTIDQAISALNTAVEQTAQDKADADVSAQNASADAERAEEARTDAQNYASSANTSSDAAYRSASSAQLFASQAETSAQSAETARQETTSLVAEAQGYASASAQSASQASASEQGCARAVLDAASAAAIARARAEEASGYAQTASEKAQDASGYAQTASEKASEASQSATTASNKASEASGYATASQTAQGLAESARDDAEQAKDDSEQIKSDVQDLADGIDTRLVDVEDGILKAFPTDTALGAVASFTDGADGLPLKSLVVDIDPVQDLHGYDSPWVAGGGVNGLLPMARSYSVATNGITLTYDADTEAFSLSGTNFKTDSAWILLNSSVYTLRPLSSGTTYYFAHNLPSGTYGQITYNKTGGGVAVLAYTNGNDSFNKVSFALPENFDSVARVQIGVRVTTDTISARGIHFGVYEENPTAWSPYENICPISGWTQVGVNQSGADMTNPTTIAIDLGQTVYGGKLDVLTGILTVYPEYDSYNGETLTGRWISDRDVYAVGTTPTIGAQVVNVGAQGTEIQLTPHEVKSLLGQNNIFADTGDSAVEYRADTTLYISRLTEPDADMIADANITSGKYFMVGNSLYKATANIANGAQIIVGTNCTRKSLSEALNEINA